MTIHQVYNFFKKFRENRMRRFLGKFELTPETTILDVGGFYRFWEDSGITSKVTILRLEGAEQFPTGCPSNFCSVQGDGCDLRNYADKSFDIVFSNSVIEHVGDMRMQIRFANEAARVGKSYWVQTPAMEFPVEPHLLTPFYHYMPRPMQEKLFRFTVWGLMHPGRVTLEDYHNHSRAYLLTRRKLASLFPGAEIITERALGLPKSYSACHRG